MKNIKIKLINNQNLRQEFIKKFLMSWEEFQVVHKDFIADMFQNHKINFDEKRYKESYMWDRMHPDYPRVSFLEALASLKNMEGNVIFMSEDEYHPYPGELLHNDEYIKFFIAEANAQELSELIEFEWFNPYYLAQQDMLALNAVLPEDLYVFYSSMDWFIVFTHETTDWDSELDEPLKAAASRYCIMSETK